MKYYIRTDPAGTSILQDAGTGPVDISSSVRRFTLEASAAGTPTLTLTLMPDHTDIILDDPNVRLIDRRPQTSCPCGQIHKGAQEAQKG